jgi:hypothetical protein
MEMPETMDFAIGCLAENDKLIQIFTGTRNQ